MGIIVENVMGYEKSTLSLLSSSLKISKYYMFRIKTVYFKCHMINLNIDKKYLINYKLKMQLSLNAIAKINRK